MDSKTDTTAGRRRWTGRTDEPDDAHRGYVAPHPDDRAEAAADREMADAERAVVMGTADERQAMRVSAIGGARTHEERRRQWMGLDEPAASARS